MFQITLFEDTRAGIEAKYRVDNIHEAIEFCKDSKTHELCEFCISEYSDVEVDAYGFPQLIKSMTAEEWNYDLSLEKS